MSTSASILRGSQLPNRKTDKLNTISSVSSARNAVLLKPTQTSTPARPGQRRAMKVRWTRRARRPLRVVGRQQYYLSVIADGEAFVAWNTIEDESSAVYGISGAVIGVASNADIIRKGALGRSADR
ncbi:Fc.00g094940.m01.CDS01 [Cosmosporella sp. VM-42]